MVFLLQSIEERLFYGARTLEIGAILRKLDKYIRSGGKHRPCTYANRNTADIVCIMINGIFKRKK